MSKELYEVTIDYTKDYGGESWIATIGDEKYIDMGTFERTKADLEAKLAESEKLKDDAFYNYAWLNQEVSDVKQKLKDTEDTYKTLCYNYQNLGKAYNELEQQLAEKEKEIEEVRSTHIYRFYLDKYKVQDVYMTDLMLEVFNQDKISFCIKRLEKLKEWLEPKYFDNEQITYLTKIVDNQIEQLKKDQINELKENK